MDIYLFILIFFLGLIVGSFLNALSFRYNSGVSILNTRSKCMSCGHHLHWTDLVPFFSFIFLKGRCRYCRTKISIQYPLVETLTATVFLISFIHSGFPTVLYWWFAWSLLIVISVYDLKHKVIPDGLVYILSLTSLVSLFFSFHLGLNTVNFLSGPIFFLPFALIWLFSGGRLMGLGDAKLFLALGWILGFREGLSAVVISFWAGALLSLIYILTYKIFGLKKNAKELTIKSEVPFGPFIALGIFIVYLFGFDVLNFALISIF